MTAVEFSKTPSGQNIVFHLRDDASSQELEKQLHASGFGLKFVARTHVGGESLLIAEGSNIQEPLTMWFESQGSSLELTKHEKPVDPWIIRSVLGFGGQTLQLASAFMQHKTNWGTFVFASTNLTANAINLFYGAQDKDDPHQLKFLKEKYNRALTPHMQSGEIAPPTTDARKELRDSSKKAGVNDFMKEHSVNVGELGLRYLGAFGLAFPVSNWKAATQAGSIFGWFDKAQDASKFRTFAGVASIGGKTVALGSQVPDPYNPEKKSWLDNIREKYTFLTGGLIETVAYSALAYDSFKDKSSTQIPGQASAGFKFGNRDWLGGVGASMFVLGYIVRSWAKYGVRNVDMDELYAHVSDTLAKTDPEKLPQLLADTAADIMTHFKDNKELDYGSIYTALVNDLKRYHHIDVANIEHKQSHTPATKVAADTVEHMQEVETQLPVKAASSR